MFHIQIQLKLDDRKCEYANGTYIYMCMFDRFGGFAAFVIYMVTTFSLYVPDWSFVDHNGHEPKRYTVSNLSMYLSSIFSNKLLLGHWGFFSFVVITSSY